MQTRETHRVTGQPGHGADGYYETEAAALSSIELQRAKDGTYYWTHKRYYRPDESMEAILDEMAAIDAALRRRFSNSTSVEKVNDASL